jgi:hypothetical protein
MEVANLDMIVRRTLLEKGLPIHYYPEVLFHQAAAIRELARHSLQLVNYANLPVNDYGAIDLPSDFQDDVMLGLPAGGVYQPIPKKSNVNPIRIHDTTTGAFEPYETQEVSSGETVYGFLGSWNWFWNVNDYGEPTGRYFGAGGGVSYGYEVIRSRRQIQLVGGNETTDVLLIYVSNGQHIDNATQVDWRAFRAIQTFSDWQMSPNAKLKDSAEARTFYNETRLMRAAISDLTVTDIKNIIRNSFTATYKS